MINKKKALLMLATAAICCGMASTAFAAPGKFNVKADELEYDLQSGKGLGKGNVIIYKKMAKQLQIMLTLIVRLKPVYWLAKL